MDDRDTAQGSTPPPRDLISLLGILLAILLAGGSPVHAAVACSAAEGIGISVNQLGGVTLNNCTSPPIPLRLFIRVAAAEPGTTTLCPLPGQPGTCQYYTEKLVPSFDPADPATAIDVAENIKSVRAVYVGAANLPPADGMIVSMDGTDGTFDDLRGQVNQSMPRLIPGDVFGIDVGAARSRIVVSMESGVEVFGTKNGDLLGLPNNLTHPANRFGRGVA
ncbi:MAG: hypothetical protein ACE5ID_12140, partial [Acidobacteriota bacterium]